ncbi:MAG: mechanosensitive ion channel [Deltaproteobacteria bacterium]|nr:mechanosensitive ion channel [Deltaproteobacteria bacterium]
MENSAQYLVYLSALWMPKVIGVAVLLIVFFILAKLMKRIINNAAGRLKLDENIASLLARTSSIALTVFGVVTALGTLGINVSALVAGLGLTGFALGFALKDSISNLLSGILILLYQPFETGNRIRIAGYEGIVVAIDLRYTKLESEGNNILIPNSKLFTDPIMIIS